MTSTKGLPDEKLTVLGTAALSFILQLALLERDLDVSAGVDSLVERLQDEALETDA